MALVLDIEPGPSTGGLPLQLEIEVAGQPPVRQILDRRKRVKLRFASPYPKRLHLRTKDGGVRVCDDPRPLNFRLFHAEWERKRIRGGRRPVPPGYAASGPMDAPGAEGLARADASDPEAGGGRSAGSADRAGFAPAAPPVEVLRRLRWADGMVRHARHCYAIIARGDAAVPTRPRRDPPGTHLIFSTRTLAEISP